MLTMFDYPDTLFGFLLQILTVAIPLLSAITLHEVGHGWVAKCCGDPTASMMGRLSLNPIKHIDPMGTLFVPTLSYLLGGMVFGWAKPVPVDFSRLKKPRRDTILVALAGPSANFFLAIAWLVTFKIFSTLSPSLLVTFLMQMAVVGAWTNVVLMIFNLLPIPPLDGSRIIAALLPKHWQEQFEVIAPYSMILLIILLTSGMLHFDGILYAARELLGWLSSI